MPVYAASEVPGWDFARTPAGAALLVEFGRKRGLAVADVLAGSRLAPDQLRDPEALIDAQQELAVANNLARLLGDPVRAGLDAGLEYHVGAFGIFGYACLTSPTLGAAVRFALKHFELTYAFCLPVVTVDGAMATMHLEAPVGTGPATPFLIARDFAAIATVMSDLLGGEVPLVAVSLAVPPPSEGADRTIYGVRPRFGAATSTVTFEARHLDQPLPQASPMTVAMCESQCRELITRRRARSGVAQQVRDRLVSVDGAPHTISRVARALAMSERTLRRRLAEENTTFRQLLDEVHIMLAEELLGTGALSVDDVALRLGYAEASSFIAAFKRWTGTTPARYRRAPATAAR